MATPMPTDRLSSVDEQVERIVQSVRPLEPYDQPLRAKLQRGERVTSDDVLAARTQQGDEGVVNPLAIR